MSGKSSKETPSKSTSPYKAVSRRNNQYCGYVSMSSLTSNKPYKIYKLEKTEHQVYGSGELAFVKTNHNHQQRVQLPGKYLKEMTSEQLDSIREDIRKGKLPFLVYRETLPDKSFVIDILPNVPEMEELHNKWADVRPIEELEFMESSSESQEEEEQQPVA